MQIMGILNVTPDSFSDGGNYFDHRTAIARGKNLFAQGADIVDIGGESTRPGYVPVDTIEELRRVIPVVEALSVVGKTSIDTSSSIVAAAAIEAGVKIVNDVSGGSQSMYHIVAKHQCEYVLTHSRDITEISLDHFCDEVWAWLDVVREEIVESGLDSGKIICDPGIGFAKNSEKNMFLLTGLAKHTRSRRVLIGASRKRFIGNITEESIAENRLGGSLTVALHAYDAGAEIIRVHDVKETKDALAMHQALHKAKIQ